MYRKPRGRDRSGLLDLDSLMDILSCLVGVMLFLVIYTVLELGSAAYQAPIPVVRDPPVGRDPIIVIAERGTVRPLDVRRPLNELLRGVEIVPSADIPLFVDQANARPTRDEFFEYELTFGEEFRQLVDPLRSLSLEVREREGVVGDSLHQLDAESRFAAVLSRLDPDEHWLAFEVDSATVDEFRRARDMASQRGFAVMWNPKQIDFPFTHPLAGGSPTDLLRSRSSQSQPER